MTFAELKTGDKFTLPHWHGEVLMKIEKNTLSYNAIWLTNGLKKFAGKFTTVILDSPVINVEIETFKTIKENK